MAFAKLNGDAAAHTIRAARAGEAGLLSELALRSKAHWGYSPEFIEACRAELSYREEQLQSKHMRFFVLERAEIVIGFYALALQSGQAAELEALFVEPRFIGKGFGRVLIEDAKSVAATLGATLLIIQGDPNAERFYLAAGGVLSGTRESGSIPGRFLPTFEISLTGDHAA
jgi:N-acetylglutamate synthase-like GNAT family acetyltransferase